MIARRGKPVSSEGAVAAPGIGLPASLSLPHDAFASGAVIVHQKRPLAPSLSIGETIFRDRLPMTRRLGLRSDRRWRRLPGLHLEREDAPQRFERLPIRGSGAIIPGAFVLNQMIDHSR